MTFATDAVRAQEPATIRGRVVAADTGLPLRRALVALRRADPNTGGLATETDEDGRFAIATVPSGRYRLGASKTGYVDAALGAPAPGRPGRAFDVAAGQAIDVGTVRLAAAGVITGRVVDDAGEPVAHANVMALRPRRTRGGATRLATTMYGRSTDDTGAYRLFGIPPGRYVLSATPGHRGPRAHDLVDTSGSALTSTYYPSTPVASEAQPIEVVAGLEVSADIALVPTRVTSVSGEVVDAAGRPAKVGFLHLMPQGRDEAADASGWLHGVVREGGGFTVPNVPPGDYTLSVQAFFADDELLRMMGSGTLEGGAYTLPLAVSGMPLTDLRIVVPPYIDVAGRISFEGDPPLDNRPAVTVFAASATTTDGQMGPRTQAGPDGRFTLRVRPGSWRVGALAAGRWMVKRVTFRGRAVAPDASIDVDTEPGARLELLLTSEITVLSGTAVDGNGQPLREYYVVVFPAGGDASAALPAYRTRVERADAEGRFRIEGLPPGEYLIAALEDHDPEQGPPDDELLDGLRPGATRVRLDEGAAAPVSLKVSPAP